MKTDTNGRKLLYGIHLMNIKETLIKKLYINIHSSYICKCQNSKQAKCLLTGEWIKDYKSKVDYYSPSKME
jgi:hypothetical protein